jgi:adenylate cyclase
MVEQPPSNHLGIVYVDVVVTSPAHEPPGDAATSPAVLACLARCENVVATHGGRAVKTNFDGGMFAFPDVDSALLAGREMQIYMEQNPVLEARDLAIRIGVHFGSPITAGVAAQRVALLAGGGQIFTTTETFELLPAHQRTAINRRELPSRTKPQNITVYEVMWQTSRNPGRHPEAPPPVSKVNGVARMRLLHHGRESAVVTKIVIGRRAGHDIELSDPRASRDHASIERRDDKFVLVDRSSHGTYISLNGSGERRLHHGELVLQGNGVISFAYPAGHQGAEVVEFWCEPAAQPPTGR